MHYSESIFDDLPKNASDDEIIEKILASLCEEEVESFIFEDNPIAIDENRKKRIINTMIKEGIAKKGSTIMGSAHTLIYTQEGKNIYYDRGWRNAVEKRQQQQNYQTEIGKLREENLRLNNEILKLRHNLIETDSVHIDILKYLKPHTDFILVEAVFNRHNVKEENKIGILNEMKKNNLIDYRNPTPPPTMYPSPGNIPTAVNGVLGFVAKISFEGHKLLNTYETEKIQKDASKQFYNYGSMHFGNNANVVLLSDSSSINSKSSEEILSMLDKIVKELKEQPSNDIQSKAEYLNLYENLSISLKEMLKTKSPIIDNLVSVAQQVINFLY